MNNPISRGRAKDYFYFLTVFFLFAQVLFLTDLEVVGNGDVVGGILFSFFFLIFIGLTIKGYNWARWVLTILLIVFGIVFLIAGFEIPSLKLKVVALYYLLFGLAPHFSKHLKPIINSKSSDRDNDQIQVESKPIMIEGEAHDFPYLLDRYKAMLIDSLLILIFITICVQVNTYLELSSTWVLIVYLILGFSYEPLLITYSSTIGQRIMKIRIRNIDNPKERLNLGQAYIRFFAKALLGWLSFITINFNKEKRAIHDLAASSVVVNLKNYV
ncbi:MAG: RDD family protein [Cyclobacteriaceae bacterium]